MRGKDTLLKFGCLLLATVICLYGCSNDKTTNKQEITDNNLGPSSSGQQTPAAIDNFINMATITNIDLENNTITISTSPMMGGMMPQGDDSIDSHSGASQNMEMPEGSNIDNMPQGTAPEKPENMPDGKMEQNPVGNPNDASKDNQEMKNQEPPQNQEQTFKITDSTSIYDNENNQISIGDLQVNDFIEYVADGDNLVSLNLIDSDINFKPEQK